MKRIAYLDCLSGISGDMMLGALVDAGVPLEEIQQGIDSLGLPSCRLSAAEVRKKGFRATKVTVHHPPEHAHRHLHHITDMIDGSDLSSEVKALAKQLFTRLASAEAKVHGSTLQQVHFHEVGAVDSIADIVGCAIGWHRLGVQQLVCSPIPTGQGTIQIAHGRVSVPAPATAELLQGIPIATSDVHAELTTPTGAALVSVLADQYGPLPSMTIETIGYGAGDRDLETQANLLRLLVGHSTHEGLSDQIWVLETNIDDQSSEVVGHCTQKLLDQGALDVYTTPILMKKNRPAFKVTVLCEASQVEDLEHVLFYETSTLGIRRWSAMRHKLHREPCQVSTPWGDVEGKRVELESASSRFVPEYEACRKIAELHNVPLSDVYQEASLAFAAQQTDTGQH